MLDYIVLLDVWKIPASWHICFLQGDRFTSSQKLLARNSYVRNHGRNWDLQELSNVLLSCFSENEYYSYILNQVMFLTIGCLSILVFFSKVSFDAIIFAVIILDCIVSLIKISFGSLHQNPLWTVENWYWIIEKCQLVMK